MRYGHATVERTLDELGVDYEEPVNTDWASAFCPLHDDNEPSFTIHLEDGGWRCYAGCGSSGDLAYLIEAVTGENASDARRRLKRALPADEAAMLDSIARADKREVRPQTRAEGVPEYDRSHVPRYMLKRGFTLDTLKTWDVGWDERLGAVVVPVSDEKGVVVGLVRRLLVGNPKYLNTTGLHKKDVLVGLEHLPFGTTEIVLVEGVMDAMWLHQHNVPALSTLGASLSKEQAHRLSQLFWRVWLAFDADRAGVAATRRAAVALSRVEVVKVELPEGRNDIQECVPEELQTLFQSLSQQGVYKTSA